MDFTQYKDIHDFYQKTGMTPIQAYEFLKEEVEKRKVDQNVV